MALIHTLLKIKIMAEANGNYKQVIGHSPAVLQQHNYHKHNEKKIMKARFVLKKAVFWVVAPRSLVEVYRHFRGACCLHHQGD
jgi:hypothetical protein